MWYHAVRINFIAPHVQCYLRLQDHSLVFRKSMERKGRIIWSVKLGRSNLVVDLIYNESLI